MSIYLRTNGLELPAPVQRHAERRFDAALDRFGRRILRINVFVADVNGAKGGEDKSCRAVVHLRRLPTVVVDDRDADLFALIDRVAERASLAVGRQVQRVNSRPRAVSMAGDGRQRE